MSANPFQDAVRLEGIGDHVTSFIAVSIVEVRLNEGKSLPNGASRCSWAGVCRIESKSHRAMPLMNKPSRMLSGVELA